MEQDLKCPFTNENNEIFLGDQVP